MGELVGDAVGFGDGALVVGAAVVGSAVVGTAVVGAEVVGAAVVGVPVVGVVVVGAAVDGAAVVGAFVVGEGVASDPKVCQSLPDGQSPEHAKYEAPLASMDVSWQLVSPSHSISHAPDPHDISVFPLQLSSPLQRMATLVASAASMTVLPPHELLPSQLISQASPSRHVRVASLHWSSPSQLQTVHSIVIHVSYVIYVSMNRGTVRKLNSKERGIDLTLIRKLLLI